MIKIQPLVALSCSLTAILVAISPLSALANDYSRSGTDDSVKPIFPRIDRSGTNDDGIKPVKPTDRVKRPNDPKIQKLGNVDTGVKPIAPKIYESPAKTTTTGQNDDGI